MDKEWHRSPALTQKLVKFHADYAKVNEQEAKEVMSHFEAFVIRLRQLLQSNEVHDFRYSGSTYEGLKVPSSTFEFDVMVLFKGGDQLTTSKIQGHPGYAHLKPAPGAAAFQGHLLENGFLSTQKYLAKFEGLLTKTVGELYHQNVILRKHGPALQLDVYKDAAKRNLEYSVDMVLTFETRDGLFVAKPFKSTEGYVGRCAGSTAADSVAWRQSFSLQEKDKLKTIDAGSGCRRSCARIFKVLRDSEPTLRPINSFLIKTLLFELERKYDWSAGNLGVCMMRFMARMAECFEQGRMNHFWVPNFNLLESFSPAMRRNIADRLNELVRSEDKFNVALDRAKK